MKGGDDASAGLILRKMLIKYKMYFVQSVYCRRYRWAIKILYIHILCSCIKLFAFLNTNYKLILLNVRFYQNLIKQEKLLNQFYLILFNIFYGCTVIYFILFSRQCLILLVQLPRFTIYIVQHRMFMYRCTEFRGKKKRLNQRAASSFLTHDGRRREEGRAPKESN